MSNTTPLSLHGSNNNDARMYNRKQLQQQQQQYVDEERQSFLPTTTTISTRRQYQQQQRHVQHRIQSQLSSISRTSDGNKNRIKKHTYYRWIGISNNKLQLGLLWLVLLVMTLEIWNNYDFHPSSSFSSFSKTIKVPRTTQLPAMMDLPVVTQFDDSCYMKSIVDDVDENDDDNNDDNEKKKRKKKKTETKKHDRHLYDHSVHVPHVGSRRLLSEEEEEEDDDDEDEEAGDDDDDDDDDDEEDNDTTTTKTKKTKSKLDSHQLGPCVAKYPDRVEPDNGWLQELDWFHFRSQHAWREACYLYCIDQWDKINRKNNNSNKNNKKNKNNIKHDFPNALLSQAVIMGLPRVVEKLVHDYQMDPLEPVYWTLQQQQRESRRGGIDWAELHGSNAIQHAIRFGQAQMVATLTPSIDTTPIDDLGRTVMDYITLKGSPIRPVDASQYLHVDTTRSQNVEGIYHIHGGGTTTPRDENDDFEAMLRQSPGQGWNEYTSWPDTGMTEKCDIDIVYGSMSRQTFYRNYYLPGRPFVLRGIIPPDEITAFRRSRWETSLPRFQPDTTRVYVGPTAYPNLTGQDSCHQKMTIADIEAGQQCPELPPDTPILHAWHPNERDFVDLFPSYEEGDVYDKKSGWRKLGEWFYPEVMEFDNDVKWQVFFGGDQSGATMHWHNAAFNVLYVGIKGWKLTAPWYRAFTGMTAKMAATKVDGDIGLSCTQYPGDFVYIPNYWGHMTLNRGFTIGAATIMSDPFQSYADDKPRIHFVHINKTGGSSMLEMLLDRCQPHYISESWGENQRTFHATAHALIDHNGRDAWDNAYTFTIVRHPLARLVSSFFFLLLDQCSSTGTLSRTSCEKRLIPVNAEKSLKTDAEKIDAFHKYVHELYEKYPPGNKDHYLFGALGHGNQRFDTFNATQTSWLVDEQGKIAVKNIFHLESLSTDMGKLAQDLPCLQNEGEAGRRKLLEMVHENATPKYPDYKLFGHNDRTNQILREVFGVDYQNFGYEY